jgi:hypothetical protein
MSALPPKADITERYSNVRFVPIADIGWVSAFAYLDFSPHHWTGSSRGHSLLGLRTLAIHIEANGRR